MHEKHSRHPGRELAGIGLGTALAKLRRSRTLSFPRREGGALCLRDNLGPSFYRREQTKRSCCARKLSPRERHRLQTARRRLLCGHHGHRRRQHGLRRTDGMGRSADRLVTPPALRLRIRARIANPQIAGQGPAPSHVQTKGACPRRTSPFHIIQKSRRKRQRPCPPFRPALLARPFHKRLRVQLLEGQDDMVGGLLQLLPGAREVAVVGADRAEAGGAQGAQRIDGVFDAPGAL